MIYSFVSIKNIIEGIYRDYNSQEELAVDDLIEWAGEALDLIGAHQSYEEIQAEGEVCSYRLVLPCGLKAIQQISYNGSPLLPSTGTFGSISTEQIPTPTIYGRETDTLPQIHSTSESASYYVNGTYIVFSFETGTISISYTRTPIDDDGFPKIPDNVSYSKAIKSYCQAMLDRQDWRKGRLPEAVYRDSQRDWDWYCRQAKGSANMPDLAKMESIKNQWVRLKPNMNSFNSFFSDLNTREIKLHK